MIWWIWPHSILDPDPWSELYSLLSSFYLVRIICVATNRLKSYVNSLVITVRMRHKVANSSFVGTFRGQNLKLLWIWCILSHVTWPISTRKVWYTKLCELLCFWILRLLKGINELLRLCTLSLDIFGESLISGNYIIHMRDLRFSQMWEFRLWFWGVWLVL